MLDENRLQKTQYELLKPSIKFKDDTIKYPKEDTSSYTSEDEVDW